MGQHRVPQPLQLQLQQHNSTTALLCHKNQETAVMASMVALFSTLGENIPIFKREKILQAYSEGYINRLHYRATCMLIMAMTVMVTCPEWISGEWTYAMTRLLREAEEDKVTKPPPETFPLLPQMS